MSAICSLTVVCFYLIVQMVGAGGLIELLFGLDYWIAVVVVGVLMTVYVSFGGMIATTWVQIIKAALLGIGGVSLALLSLSHADFSFEVMAAKAVAVYSNGIKLMAPGNFLTDPVTVISLSVGLVFGTMGLPHILMRFFTVANSKEARKSVFYATIFIGLFFLASALIGLGAIIGVGTDSQFFEGGRIGGKIIGGNNMIALHLAKALGGHLLLGFLSAVTFATIIAVVAGLGLAGAANISHDIYARVIKKGQVTSAQELKVSRFATIIIGVVGIILGIMFKDLNLTFLVGLAFGIAASANFPVLFLAMFWSGLTTRGALFGGLTGLVSAVLMVVLSKSVWVIVLGNAHPIFPYEQPALFSMPLAFIVAYLASKFDHSEEAEKERAAFFDQEVRAQTGVGAAGASMH
jgi:cation/acetate symporter